MEETRKNAVLKWLTTNASKDVVIDMFKGKLRVGPASHADGWNLLCHATGPIWHVLAHVYDDLPASDPSWESMSRAIGLEAEIERRKAAKLVEALELALPLLQDCKDEAPVDFVGTGGPCKRPNGESCYDAEEREWNEAWSSAMNTALSAIAEWKGAGDE